MGRRISQFLNDESGATAIEYALIASMISIGVLSGVSLMTGQVGILFETVADAFMGAIGNEGTPTD